MPVGDRLGLGAVQGDGMFARVEHDEVVAQAVHFEERGHGGLIGRLRACFSIALFEGFSCPLPLPGEAKISILFRQLLDKSMRVNLFALLSVPSLPQEPLP